MARTPDWEQDQAFLNIARGAWPADLELALGERRSSNYDARTRVRQKMKHRHEGYQAVRFVGAELDALQERCNDIQVTLDHMKVRVRGG